MSTLRKIRWPLLGAGAAALAVTAIAGATHFGPFNLEHTNGPTDVASGISGSLNGPVLFGSNSNTGANAHGVQGGHVAGGVGAGVRGFTASVSPSARGVFGQVTSTAPGSMSAAVRGLNAGTGLNGIGVWGSQNGSGWGVYGSVPNGTGVRGVHTATTGTQAGVEGATSSNADGAAGVRGTAPGGLAVGVRGENADGVGVLGTGRLGVSGIGTTGFGVRGSSSSGTGVLGESVSGYSGTFSGGTGVQVDGNLRVRGSILAHEGSFGNCPRGAVNGIVNVDASGTFSSSYTSAGVTGFNCNGGSLLAKRNGAGNYTVLLGGNASALWAIGNSTETANDAFVIVRHVSSGPAGREFQVIVWDKDGGNEDADFVIVAF